MTRKKDPEAPSELNAPKYMVDGSKRFNRNLAILAREMVPPELLIEFHLAILQNHDPHITRDARCASGWNVTWSDQGELRPTLAEKSQSIKFLREAGWGMPAQMHVIEADVRSHQGDSGLDTRALAGNPALAHRLVMALQAAMAAGPAGVGLLSAPEAADESDEDAEPVDAGIDGVVSGE